MSVTYLRGNKVLVEEKLVKATVEVTSGKITKITKGDCDLSGVEKDKIIDAGDNVLMSGLVDTHTHIDEPGRTEWEGFWTATRAAAAGGFTTLIDMPLQCSPPTTTVENFDLKLKAAEGKLHVDCGFWGGAIGNNIADLKPLLEKGVWGFKCFLIDTGFDEFPFLHETDLERTMAELEGTGCVLLCHAEIDCKESEKGTTDKISADRDKYSTLLAHRPESMEVEAIQMIERNLQKHKGLRTHIVHLAAASALPVIRGMKKAGLHLTVETCPHYLHFTQDDIDAGWTEFKCLPPIRSVENREKLWEGIGNGTIDLIAADHANCTPNCKQKDFIDAWGGICGLQYGISSLWSSAKKHGHNVVDIWRWMSKNPAKLAGIDGFKGEIRVGNHADFVIWNPDGKNEINVEMAEAKNKLSPYNGKTLEGKVLKTILRGKVIFDDGVLSKPHGEFVLKKRRDNLVKIY